jgi:hypothetical protein
MSAKPLTEPCCLPNEIITNTAAISWTIEEEHHINCAYARKDTTK